MHPRATEEGDTPHPPPRVPSPLRKPVVTGGTHPQLLHLCVCLCAGCAIPSAPKQAQCYVRVLRSARLERRGCDQDIWLSGDKAFASGTQSEHWGCGSRDDTW